MEKCNFLDRESSRQRYQTIAKDMLRDLCTIFFTFKRVDFAMRNMPFTPEGKIAFIDTGYLIRITEDLSFRRKNYEKCVDKLVGDANQQFAKSLWDGFKKRRRP